jgi:uncharacterized protein YdeI (YjbR/CyaY-like superfamily)
MSARRPDPAPRAAKPLPAAPLFFDTPASFRTWLADNHATARELLVGFHKRGTGKPSITWPESVDEALCFGWIDGVRRSVSPDAYSIRFTPRKPTSIWSAVNVGRVAELTRLGKMTPAGQRAFAARTEARTGVYSFERNQAAVLSPAHELTLRADARAAAYFDAQAPWYRRAATHWVISAKREETRDKRLAQLVEACAAGEPIAPLRRPVGKASPPAPRRAR